MKLSYEAQDLLGKTITSRKGGRMDTQDLIEVLAAARNHAIIREESSVSLATMADALGMGHYLDARVLGHHDAVEWAKGARELHPAMFDLDCFQRIAQGLMEDAARHYDERKNWNYSHGWREGVIGYLASLKRGDAR